MEAPTTLRTHLGGSDLLDRVEKWSLTLLRVRGGEQLKALRFFPHNDNWEEALEDDTARTILTYTLAATLAVSVAMAWFFFDRIPAKNATEFQHLETMIGVIITPVFSLFSAAVGFYYGERHGQKPKDKAKGNLTE